MVATLFACGGASTSVDASGISVDGAGDGAVDGAVDASGDLSSTSYYLPTGFQLAPFLSSTPVYEFTSASPATDAGKDYFAVLETDVGRIVFDLYETQTPITVNSFVFLARNHFFDGQAFHRVINGFVAQGGDPNSLDPDSSSWGLGGPGYMFGTEIVSSLQFDSAGVVGMARGSSMNSNGSQFFITLAAAHSLDGQYTVFAKVTEGADLFSQIVRGEPPDNPTRMTRVYIIYK